MQARAAVGTNGERTMADKETAGQPPDQTGTVGGVPSEESVGEGHKKGPIWAKNVTRYFPPENRSRLLVAKKGRGLTAQALSGLLRFREHHLAEIVLCSAFVYTAFARLHRTNSPATRLQQPVAPRNKSSQHTLPYTPVAGRIRPTYASHTPLWGCMEREIATVGFRE